MKRLAIVIGACLCLVVGCAQERSETASATPCEQVIAGCHVKRLDNLILRGNQTSGALRSVDGFDLDGIISFDQALLRASKEDGWHSDAESFQVVLGSADADANHWGHGKRLYYAVDWAGVCNIPAGLPGSSHTASCIRGTAGTVIDALTGDFIVGGESSP